MKKKLTTHGNKWVAGLNHRALLWKEKGLKSSIDVLKTMREVQIQRSTRRTPYEGVPISVPLDDIA